MRNNLLITLYLSILIVLCGCVGKNIEENTTKTLYRAINKDDTATFIVKLTDKQFYGQLEINYHGAYKDSGAVTGAIKGDTLRGNYRFQHYGMETWYRTPIALLRKDGKLIMGTGALEVYMGITFFKKNRPIDYEVPRFVFEKM